MDGRTDGPTDRQTHGVVITFHNTVLRSLYNVIVSFYIRMDASGPPPPLRIRQGFQSFLSKTKQATNRPTIHLFVHISASIDIDIYIFSSVRMVHLTSNGGWGGEIHNHTHTARASEDEKRKFISLTITPKISPIYSKHCLNALGRTSPAEHGTVRPWVRHHHRHRHHSI